MNPKDILIPSNKVFLSWFNIAEELDGMDYSWKYRLHCHDSFYKHEEIKDSQYENFERVAFPGEKFCGIQF